MKVFQQISGAIMNLIGLKRHKAKQHNMNLKWRSTSLMFSEYGKPVRCYRYVITTVHSAGELKSWRQKLEEMETEIHKYKLRFLFFDNNTGDYFKEEPLIVFCREKDWKRAGEYMKKHWRNKD